MALKVLLIILGLVILWQVFFRLFRKRVHFPAPAFIGYFLDTDIRRRMQSPDKLVQRSGIEEGMTVLEIGCGSGAFTTFIAKTVGNDGKIYALDIQPEMLKQLRNKLSGPEYRNINNIELIEISA